MKLKSLAIESKDIKDFMELLYGDVIRDYLKQIETESKKERKMIINNEEKLYYFF